jgi:hypothetical protein
MAEIFGFGCRPVPLESLRHRMAAVILMLLAVPGCCANHPTSIAAKGSLSVVPTSGPVLICAPTWDEVLQAEVTPPQGWKPDPLKVTNKSRHRVWISPTGDTAYGVIYIDLPLPVGKDMAYDGFIKGMKNTSGEAIVLEKTEDSDAIHFTADGGLYRIRCNLSTSGFHGWCVYAGTLRAKPVIPRELKLAEEARDRTQVGGR